MALIKLGQGIIDIVGKLGSLYFHRGKSGLHLSKKPQRTKPPTGLQIAQRGFFSQCVKAFTEHDWSPAELQKWYDFSKRHFTRQGLGSKKPLTAQNLFVGYNCLRLSLSLPMSFVPPDD